jgi:sporulation protein YlmC with PRC-barrel domain
MTRMTMAPLHKVSGVDRSQLLDLRGWTVVATDGCTLGTVADVIVDVDTEAPVYLSIVPRSQNGSAPSECWIRVPYRHVSVDEGERHVKMNDIALLGLGTATMALRSDRFR